MSRRLPKKEQVALRFLGRFWIPITFTALLMAACGQPPSDQDAGETTAGETTGAETTAQEALTPGEGALVIYSGRSEELVGPLFEQYEEESGVDVQVRYGDTAELAATILEEGENSPADLFFAQDPGALGALTDEGRFRPLPQETLYITDELSESDLPDSIFGFTDPEWEGKIGWAPTNGSFQAFVTALRVLEGEDVAREWLEGIQANDPFVYPDNATALEGVAAGEVEVAFVNHYYLYQALEEQGEDIPARNYYLKNGDPGALVLAAGAGILDTAQNPEAAQSFLEFALSEEAQRYFADETYEYPLVEGVEPAEDIVPLSEIQSPRVDLSNLDDLQGTLDLLQETGVL
jgi:iron(III) transport system substrate-binding protein